VDLTGSGGSSTSGSATSGGIDIPSSGGSGAIDVDDACIIDQAEAELVEEPVDIILVLDNSGSMRDEIESVEQNINVNFANILTASGVDFRLLLLSRHRKEERAESGESSTSICVEAPLSGLAACPNQVPVQGERFFHYNEKIESSDSLDNILAWYHRPDERSNLTVLGWSEWLRVGAKKVVLEITDADEVDEGTATLTVDDFLTRLTMLAPEHFGADPMNPNITWHSIIGLAEKAVVTDPYLPDEGIEDAECTGNDDEVTNAGQTYQELSIRTGGLRFPLCQFDAYDVVFQTIAEDVVVKSNIACDFAIPEPPRGEELDLGKVAVNYAPGDGGDPTQFGQALNSGVCQQDAFYIESDRIFLCPEACDAIRADPAANVDVLFTCESTIIVR
jgi:hypothetical protein